MTMASVLVENVLDLIAGFLSRAFARKVNRVLLRLAKGCDLMAFVLQEVAGAGYRGGRSSDADSIQQALLLDIA